MHDKVLYYGHEMTATEGVCVCECLICSVTATVSSLRGTGIPVTGGVTLIHVTTPAKNTSLLMVI